jgi:hypothetical protein
VRAPIKSSKRKQQKTSRNYNIIDKYVDLQRRNSLSEIIEEDPMKIIDESFQIKSQISHRSEKSIGS